MDAGGVGRLERGGLSECELTSGTRRSTLKSRPRSTTSSSSSPARRCRCANCKTTAGSSSIAVTVGDGRLVVAARAVDLAPVAWPWRLADGVVGVLPRSDLPTVDEFIAGLTCAQAVA